MSRSTKGRGQRQATSPSLASSSATPGQSACGSGGRERYWKGIVGPIANPVPASPEKAVLADIDLGIPSPKRRRVHTFGCPRQVGQGHLFIKDWVFQVSLIVLLTIEPKDLDLREIGCPVQHLCVLLAYRQRKIPDLSQHPIKPSRLLGELPKPSSPGSRIQFLCAPPRPHTIIWLWLPPMCRYAPWAYSLGATIQGGSTVSWRAVRCSISNTSQRCMVHGRTALH